MSRRWSLAFASVVVIVALWLSRPLVRGLAFVVRAAEFHGVAGRVASLDAAAVSTEDVVATGTGGRGGFRRGRLYVPTSPRRYTLLTSGLHPSGIDEPRLVNLARQLAASGDAVFTPDIPELSRFEISPAITDGIEAAAEWLARRPEVQRLDGRVGLIGISFSGGLSLVAAGRPGLRDRVAYVVSFGGHDDLPRVLRFLCTGQEPYPSQQLGVPANQPYIRAPHDYGVAIMLLGIAPRLVPAAQVAPLQGLVRRYLDASALDDVNKEAAAVEFSAIRDAAARMPEPSATLARYMVERDVVHLGARLLPYINAFGGDAALSLARSPKPSASIYLLHGADDNVIPPLESEYLANDLRGHGPVRLLLSDLISHAAADRTPHATDVLRLADFWGDVLSR